MFPILSIDVDVVYIQQRLVPQSCSFLLFGGFGGSIAPLLRINIEERI
jgi:hypothetical protein